MANFDGGFSGRPVLLRLVVNEDSINIEGNYSNMAWQLQAIKTGNTTAWASDPSNWQVSISGLNWNGNWSYNFNGGIGQTIVLGGWVGFTHSHNSDGTGLANCSAAAQDLHGYLGNASCGGSMGLTTIPRATTPTFTNPMIMGDPYTINLPRASSGFTHTVQYFFGSTSGTIATGAGTSTSWTPPTSLLTQIPNSASGTGFIRVITFSGATNIGTRDVSLTLTAPAAAVPDFTTITHSEAVAGVAANIGGYVQAISKLALAITGAVGYSGSTIASYKIEVGGQTVNAQSGTTPGTINGSGTVTITGTVTDSRGRIKVKTVNITVLAYAPPVINAISAVRSDGAGVPNEEGAYIRVNIDASVQSLIVSTQRNAINYKIYTRVRGVATWTLKDTTTPGGITFNGAEAVGTYSIETAYDVLVEVYDDFSTSAFALTIPTAAIFMHWDGRDGVGIGKYRQQGNLDVLGAIYQNDGKLVLDEVTGGRPALLPKTYRGTTPDVTVTFLDALGGTGVAKWQTPYIPHASRVVYVKRDYLGGWSIISHSGQPDQGGWATLPLSGTWRAYTYQVNDLEWAEPRFTKLTSGIVVLEGLVYPGSITSGSIIGVLPVGFRPDTDMIFITNNGDTAKSIRVNANGEIRVQGPNWVSNFATLSNIVFPAAGVATWTNVGAGGSGSAFANSWVDYGDAAYGVARFWKDPYGIVWLAGMVKNGSTAADNTVMFTLPSTHSAYAQQHLVTVSADGQGHIGSGPPGTGDGVTYKIGNVSNAWISLSGVTIVTADGNADNPWTEPYAFASGWANHPGGWPTLAECRREDGLSMLRGLISAGAFGSFAWLLRPENRPARGLLFAAISNAARGRFDIKGVDATTVETRHGATVPNQGSNWFSLDSHKWVAG